MERSYRFVRRRPIFYVFHKKASIKRLIGQIKTNYFLEKKGWIQFCDITYTSVLWHYPVLTTIVYCQCHQLLIDLLLTKSAVAYDYISINFIDFRKLCY